MEVLLSSLSLICVGPYNLLCLSGGVRNNSKYDLYRSTHDCTIVYDCIVKLEIDYSREHSNLSRGYIAF